MRYQYRLMALAGAGVLAATGCGLIGGASGDSGPGKGAKDPFTVAFAGDVHFEGVLRTRLDSAPDTALGPIAGRLKAADLTVANLETAITTGGTPAPKQFTFRAPPTAFRALRSAGVDVVTMANNHGMDYGETGLADTLAASKAANFPVVGIGADAAAAYKPWMTTVKGHKVAVLGATQVLDDNLVTAWTATAAKGGLASAKDAPRMVQAVKEARRTADVVIVDLHWGQELNTCATDVQKQLAVQLVDAGADAVVGSHAHVLQGGGFLKGKYVHYGLGNFAFYNSGETTGRTGVLTLTFAGSDARVTGSAWDPAQISEGIPQPLAGAEAQQARTAWQALRKCTNLTATTAG